MLLSPLCRAREPPCENAANSTSPRSTVLLLLKKSMKHRIPQKQMPVEVTYDAGLIECGALTVFLTSLGSHATVFLTPLERSFWFNAMYKVHQFVVHVTARGDEANYSQLEERR